MRLLVRSAGARFELCDGEGPIVSSRNSASLVELAMDLLARADTPYDSVAIETGPVPTVVTFQARMFDVRRADGKQSTFAHDDARTAVREIAAPASDADPPSDS